MRPGAAALIALASLACGPRGPRGQVLSLALPAPSLQGARLRNAREQPGLVLLPRSYGEGARRYPVLYYLPGFTTDPSEYLDGSYHGLDLRALLDRLAASGGLRELIVVIPNGRNALGGSFYVNSLVTGGWEDYVVRDVVSYVDARFRTIAAREGRGVAGDSMGGFGAVHLAMRHGELFSAAYALSPSLFDEHGLADLGVFTRPEHVRSQALMRPRLAGWPAGEAPERLLGFARELYGGVAGYPFNYYRAFALAYGAAFAPEPAAGAPFFAQPCTLEQGRVTCDTARLARLESGFGALAEKVSAHAEALRSLSGLVLECGANDRHGWDLRGTRRLAALLRAAGVPHELVEHEGGHDDRVPEAMEERLLPFFSQRLGDPRADRPGAQP